MKPIRVLVVDDEPLARRRVLRLLENESNVEVAGECGTGREAVDALAGGELDLVFLDVQMPELDGFGVVEEVGVERMPLVVFVTAYDQYALKAFEVHALDYLLKPFEDERFHTALQRAKRQARVRGGEAGERLSALLSFVDKPRPEKYPEVLAIRVGEQYSLVRVESIDWIEADGNYARVWVQRRQRLLAKSLAALERDVLDPDVFVRVHRSAIVNATKIAAVEPLFHGEVTLVLHDGTRVDCSRRYRKRLEDKLYFTT